MGEIRRVKKTRKIENISKKDSDKTIWRQKMKQFLSIIMLSFCLFISVFCFSENSYADETELPVAEDLIAKGYEPDHLEPFYEYIDNTQHAINWYEMFYNADLHVWLQNGKTDHIDYEGHTVSSYSYTGTNYHSEARHYFLYSGVCSKCGGTITRWSSGKCPGNGHCIAPLNVPSASE